MSSSNVLKRRIDPVYLALVYATNKHMAELQREPSRSNVSQFAVICKRLSLDSCVSSDNKFTGSFLFREYHVQTLVQYCGFEAQKIADLRSVLATFCGQEMA